MKAWAVIRAPQTPAKDDRERVVAQYTDDGDISAKNAQDHASKLRKQEKLSHVYFVRLIEVRGKSG